MPSLLWLYLANACFSAKVNTLQVLVAATFCAEADSVKLSLTCLAPGVKVIGLHDRTHITLYYKTASQKCVIFRIKVTGQVAEVTEKEVDQI